MNQIVQVTKAMTQMIGNMEGTVTMPLSEYHKLLDKANNTDNLLNKEKKLQEERKLALEEAIFALAIRLHRFEAAYASIELKKAESPSIILVKSHNLGPEMKKIYLHSLEEDNKFIRVKLELYDHFNKSN